MLSTFPLGNSEDDGNQQLAPLGGMVHQVLPVPVAVSVTDDHSAVCSC